MQFLNSIYVMLLLSGYKILNQFKDFIYCRKKPFMVFFQIVIQVPCSSRFPYLKKNFKVKLQKAQNKCIRFCPNLPPRSHRLLSGMLLRKIFYSICKANSNNYHILMIDIIISFSHSNIVFLVIIGILLSRSSYFKF